MTNLYASDSKLISGSLENPFETEYRADYESDWSIHRLYVQTFDAYEAMLTGQVYDAVSHSIDSSKITDSYAATLTMERAARVMGKLPDGVVEPIGKADQGKAAFIDILRQKWIYPNANSQHKFKIKLRLWQMYADVYGYMPMFYDWNVSPSGYVGPDCWLWNPRNLIPQQGKSSIYDMDHITALTWVSKKWIQDKIDELSPSDEDATEDAAEPKEDGGWNLDALQFLLELAGTEKSRPEQQQTTLTERTRVPQSIKRGICLATRFEAGEDGVWCTFAPDHSNVEVRRIPNPHKNGKIPFVIKYSQPLFDSFYGLGDFQRAKPLQFARDGLTNFYFKGIKMNLIPPIVANANGVVKHTLDYREGGVMLETIPNSIRRLETSSAGLATYQAAQSALTGSLLTLFGTQNASITGADALNPSQGKTPAAISLYSDKEADRDGQSREALELAIEELTDGFFSLLVNIGTESIPVSIFSQDIQDIVDAGMADVLEMFGPATDSTPRVAKFSLNKTGTGGDLMIDLSKLNDIEYRFVIDAGSTAKMNKDAQRQALENFIGMISKLQNVLQNDPRVKIEWPVIMKTYESLTSIPGVSKFITIDPEAQLPTPPQPEPKMNELINYKDAPADIQRQIEQKAGLQPSQIQPAAEVQPPAVASNGMSFRDPHLAEVASTIHGMQPEAPAAPEEPAVAANGMSFKDKHLAAVADKLSSI